MRRIFSRWLNRTLVLSLTCLSAVWLFAWLLPFRSGPTSKTYDLLFMPAFFARVYIVQVGTIALALGALLCFQRAWRWVIVASLIAATSLGPELMWRYTGRAEASGTDQRIRVASLNLLRELNDAGKAVEWVKSVNPEVVVVQELTPWIEPALTRALRERYPYEIIAPSEGYDGLGVYSRWPIAREEIVSGDVARWMPAKVHTPGGDVLLYNVHLASPQTPIKQHRMRDQIAELCRLVQGERRRTILVGDFNSTPFTPLAMQLRRAGLDDINRGRGTNATWPTRVGPPLPGVRIDTAYYRGSLEPVSSTTGPAFGSDHLPILIELQFNQ